MASKSHFKDLIERARRQLTQMEKDTEEIQKRLEAGTKQTDIIIKDTEIDPLLVEEVKLEEAVATGEVEKVVEEKGIEEEREASHLDGGLPLLRAVSTQGVVYPTGGPTADEDESNKHFDASSVTLDDDRQSGESLAEEGGGTVDEFNLQNLTPIKLEDDQQAFIPPAPQPYLETGKSLPLAKPLESPAVAPRPERMNTQAAAAPSPPQDQTTPVDVSTSDQPSLQVQSSTDQSKRKRAAGFFKKLFSKKKMGNSDSVN